jgi:hypothetical protein
MITAACPSTSAIGTSVAALLGSGWFEMIRCHSGGGSDLHASTTRATVIAASSISSETQSLCVEEEATRRHERGPGAVDLPWPGTALQLVHRLADVARALGAALGEPRRREGSPACATVDHDAVAFGV